MYIYVNQDAQLSLTNPRDALFWRANMRHRAKLCADQSRHCEDMAVFRFFKMAAD